MAKQRQMYRKVDLEELVDMFLEDKVGDYPVIYTQSVFGDEESDGTVPVADGGKTVSDSVTKELCGKAEDRELVLRQIGRSFADAGDKFWHSNRGSVSRDQVQTEITQTGQLSGNGEITAEEEEEHWRRFREMLDKALEDVGPQNPYRMLAAVLVAVKGFANYGTAVCILARRFTLRFFEEHRLKRDIERAGGIEYLTDENLD